MRFLSRIFKRRYQRSKMWLTCGYCLQKIAPEDEVLLGEAPFHRGGCADAWYEQAEAYFREIGCEDLGKDERIL
jgi:hypothetical protein